MIRPAELIERKRDGEELAAEELSDLLLGYARGDVPDYQMSAFCMAVIFRGLTAAETHALTDAMVQSGETVDLSAELGRKAVDKHSTGGVGDKTSIAVAPARRRLRRAVRQDERPRARPHGRHARQARVDPRLPRRADPRRVHRQVKEAASRSSARPPTSSRPTRSSTRCVTSPAPSTRSR